MTAAANTNARAKRGKTAHPNLWTCYGYFWVTLGFFLISLVGHWVFA